MVALFAELIGGRIGREPHDPLVQGFAGAAIGIAIAAWTANRDLGRPAALAILELGIGPLGTGFLP